MQYKFLCPLCQSDSPHHYHTSTHPINREYWQCQRCSLVFVPTQFHISPQAEKQEYDLHHNAIGDPGYVRFLSRSINALYTLNLIRHVFSEHDIEQVTQQQPLYQPPQRLEQATVLDFGSGPAPVLATMWQHLGYPCAIYDKFYAQQQCVLEHKYRIVTCTEVIEHIGSAADTWASLFSYLKRDGVLVVMTQRVRSLSAFTTWRYTHDKTHISFYSNATAHWIAKHFNVSVRFVNHDIMVFTPNP